MWELRLFTYSVQVHWETKMFFFYIYMYSCSHFSFRGNITMLTRFSWQHISLCTLNSYDTVLLQMTKQTFPLQIETRGYDTSLRWVNVHLLTLRWVYVFCTPVAGLTQRVGACICREWSALNHHLPVWLEVQLYLIVFLALLEFSMGLILRREMG